MTPSAGKGRAVLRRWIADLSSRDAENLWEYLDSVPHVVTDTIDDIAKAHEELAKRLCGPTHPKLVRRLEL
jgi:hypothetical protein